MTAAAPLFIALYTDAHITLALVQALRERGYDVVSAHEVGNSDLDDAEHEVFTEPRFLCVEDRGYEAQLDFVQPGAGADGGRL